MRHAYHVSQGHQYYPQRDPDLRTRHV